MSREERIAELEAQVASLKAQIEYYEKCTIIPPPLTAEEFDRVFPDGLWYRTETKGPIFG